MRLLIPAPDPEPYPSLGYDVCQFLTEKLVHGPGDVLGESVKLTPEVEEIIWRVYEVFPKGHSLEGRRRFKRVVLSRRKGWAKTELAAWLAICEMDPECPVRFDGWNGEWPRGRPVRDPYIPMVAFTEDQTEELAYAAVYQILARSKLVDDYDIGLERIMHVRAPGKIQALASSPSAREGARTTFQHGDETHLWFADRLWKTHATMQRNIAKRRDGDPWALETTTSWAPGQDSIAERAHDYALAIAQGRASEPRLLYDHLQADESWNVQDPDQLAAAIVQASGDAIAWADSDAIASQFSDPTADPNENRRFWLNQPRRAALHWAPAAAWPELQRTREVQPGAEVVLGFDGSYNRDSTALIGCTVETVPHVFVVKTWERPVNHPKWRTPRLEVDEVIRAAMERYTVLELAVDPPGWHRELEDWESIYGEVVVAFDTNQPSRMGPACDDFEQAVRDGDISHDGSEIITRHLANAVVRDTRGYKVIAHHRASWHRTHAQEDTAPPGFETV